MVDTTAAAFGMQPATSRGRNVPRRRDVEEQTEEAFAAEEPRLERFSLPMGADPDKDELAGVDELGNQVYISPLGVRYTIKTTTPQPKEWETEPATMARVGEVAKEYATGAVEGLTSAVTAPGRALAGEPVTTGEVLDTAGFAATGAIPGIARGAIEGVDPNVASVFAGVRAANADVLKVIDAREMFDERRQELMSQGANLERYVPPEMYDLAASADVWEQTGWFRGNDGLFRFEINDSKAQILPQEPARVSGTDALNKYITDKESYEALGMPEQYTGPKLTVLSDVLKHDELFENYPQIEDIPVFVDTSMKADTLGYFTKVNGKPVIAVNSTIAKDPQKFKSTLLHEIQHYIQNIEGFESGTNLYAPVISKVYDFEKAQSSGKIKAIWDQYNADMQVFDKQLEELNRSNQVTKNRLPLDLMSFAVEMAEKKHGVPETQVLKVLAATPADKIDPESSKDSFGVSYVTRALDQKLPFDLRYTIKNLYPIAENPTVTFEKRQDVGTADYDFFKVKHAMESLQNQYPEEFAEYFNIPEQTDLWNLSTDEILSLFAPPELQNLEAPERPLFIDPKSKGISIYDRSGLYRRKAGEVEARAVQERMDMPEEVTSQNFPRTSEDVLPQYQWTSGDVGSYAQGGTVIPNTETQMNRLMQEGGIADDGMRRDPVSGNEVPPGSMAEEVRDDIPAQLSSGEYVVPADVLRYYGVAFFEKLRAEAKRGLSEMEAGGRIGGEPVAAPMGGMGDDDLDDEDEMMLQEIMGGGMAQGGMMMSQPQQAANYDNLQPTMKLDRQMTQAFQQGGMATDPNNVQQTAQQFTSQFDPSKFKPGFLFDQPTTGTAAAVEMRTYVNAQGEIRVIPFQNGQPLEPIPEGFYPQGQVPATAQTEQAQRDDSGGGEGQEQRKSYTEYTAEDWSKYSTATPFASNFGKAIAGVVGTAIGGPLGGIAGSNLAAEAIARDGINAYNALNEFVGNMDRNDPNYDGLVGKVNEMYGTLVAEQKKSPGIIGGIIEKFFGKPEITPPNTGRTTGAGTGGGGAAAPATTGGGEDRDTTPVTTPTTTAASAPVGGRGTGATATRGTTTAAVRDVTTLEGPEAASTQRVAQDQRLGAGARGAAQGGLMVKKRVAKKAAKKRPIKTTDA